MSRSIEECEEREGKQKQTSSWLQIRPCVVTNPGVDHRNSKKFGGCSAGTSFADQVQRPDGGVQTCLLERTFPTAPLEGETGDMSPYSR